MGRAKRLPDGRIEEVNPGPVTIRRAVQPRLVLRFAEIDGRVECVRVEIGTDFDNPHEPEPIALNTSTLRASNVGGRVRTVLSRWVDELEGIRRTGRLGREKASRKVREQVRARLPIARASVGQPRYSREHYEEVAQVYRLVWGRGGDPTKAVAGRFQLSRSAAAKQVARARSMKLLPKTRRGVARGGATGRRKE